MRGLKSVSLAAALRVGADANRTGVDVSDFVGPCHVILNASAAEAADNTLDVKLQHSDVIGSGYADVTGGAFTQVTNAAASLQTLELNADSLKKYVRVVDDIGGTTPQCARSVTLVGKKQSI